MGEKQEKEKKNDEGEKKNDDGGVITVVLKLDMHCEGCAKKVRKSIRNFPGVESLKTDCATNKMTVTGKVNPIKIKERVEEKTKKTVELVSPQPPKAVKEGGNGGGSGEKKSGDKKLDEKKLEGKIDEKKSEDKKEKEKPKEPTVSTVQLKTRVHCEGCANKIKRIVSKCDGVQDVNVDLQKDLIIAKGTMNMTDLLPYLNSKLKRTVELAPTKKDDASGGDKKPKEGDSKSEKPKESGGEKKETGGEEKKKGDTNTDTNTNNTSRIEVSKMEYSPFSYDYGYAPIYDPRQQGQGYGHQVMEYWNAPEYSHPPQMFSDENPNACSVM
ncbi:hypothetical protein RND81_04G063600 [Saponaria officinalis]|uniref:HMA domain-containing protein n=1 Tax=Saponaria officinalis TaxID=3572 RepID=A0AAW1LFA6_SAPOF